MEQQHDKLGYVFDELEVIMILRALKTYMDAMKNLSGVSEEIYKEHANAKALFDRINSNRMYGRASFYVSNA